MAGISNHAPLKPENRYKYNGIELDIALGINEYEAPLRNLDPQTGRWWQIDPKSDDLENNMEKWSPYVSNYDNPVKYKDPKGDCPSCIWGAVIGAGVDYAVQVTRNRMSGKSWKSSFRDINPLEVITAAMAGAVSGGVSAFYEGAAAAGTTVLVSEVTAQVAVSGMSSVVNQVNDNITADKPLDDISIPKVAFDIAVDRIAGKVADEIVPNVNVSTLERRIDRAGRVAANSSGTPSAGRMNNLRQARTALSSAKMQNDNLKNAAGSVISVSIGETLTTMTGQSGGNAISPIKLNNTPPPPAKDNIVIH